MNRIINSKTRSDVWYVSNYEHNINSETNFDVMCGMLAIMNSETNFEVMCGMCY